MFKGQRHTAAVLVRLAGVASVAALAAGTLSTSAASASGAPGPDDKPLSRANVQLTDPVPAGFSSWPEVMGLQSRLHKAALRITDAAEANGGDQLGSVTADANDRAVNVYWKGSLPAGIRTLLTQLRRDVPVHVHAARFGQHQLFDEQMRLAHDPTVTASGQVTEISALPDATGLQVTLRPTDGVSARANSDAATRATLSSSTVPVVVVASGDSPAPAVDRYHDTTAFWGGGAFNNGTGICTTGWAVRHKGVNKMLTAGHCGENGDLAMTGDGTQLTSNFIGDLADKNAQRDIVLIDPTSVKASTAGIIYAGAFPNASAPFTDHSILFVSGADRNVLGDIVFTDGSLSGFRSNIKVTKVNAVEFLPVNGVLQLMSPLIVADQLNGQNAAGNGDSGGPVGTLSADLQHVQARGTITGITTGSTTATCTGIPASATRTCSSHVFFAPITGSLGTLGATIITG